MSLFVWLEIPVDPFTHFYFSYFLGGSYAKTKHGFPPQFFAQIPKKIKLKLKIEKTIYIFCWGQNLGPSPIANSGFFAPLSLRRGFLRPGEKKLYVNLKTASIKEGKKEL